MGRGRGKDPRTILLGSNQAFRRPSDFISKQRASFLLDLLEQDEDAFWSEFRSDLDASESELVNSSFVHKVFDAHKPTKEIYDDTPYFPEFVKSLQRLRDDQIPVFIDKPILYKKNYYYVPGDKDKSIISSDALRHYFFILLDEKKDFNTFFNKIIPNLNDIRSGEEEAINNSYINEPMARALTDSDYHDPIILNNRTIYPIGHYVSRFHMILPRKNPVRTTIWRQNQDNFYSLNDSLREIDRLDKSDIIQRYNRHLRDTLPYMFAALMAQETRKDKRTKTYADALEYGLSKVTARTMVKRLIEILPADKHEEFKKGLTKTKNWGIGDLASYTTNVSNAFRTDHMHRDARFDGMIEEILALKNSRI